MARSYSLLIIDDNPAVAATLGAEFGVPCKERTLVHHRLGPTDSVAAIQHAIIDPNPPDVIVLDNFLRTGTERAQPRALQQTLHLTRLASRLRRVRPLVILRTGGISPLMAYSFRVAGGHHVIDYQYTPTAAEQIDLIWATIDGARWTPEPHPVSVGNRIGSDRQRLILQYLADARYGDNGGAIQAATGLTAKKVSETKGQLFDRFEVGRTAVAGGRNLNGSAMRIAKHAERAGHAWVPLLYQETLFAGTPPPLDPLGPLPWFASEEFFPSREAPLR